MKLQKKKEIENKRRWDKTVSCIYCEQYVTNFTRHISRKHSTEIQVFRYNSFPKGSKERQMLVNDLRKRGNFLNNVDTDKSIKPVRRPKCPTNASQYLPCKSCYGLFKKTYLARHEKICKSAKSKLVGRNKAQSDAQNLLLAFSNNDCQLVKDVFPHMAADEISKVAKTDELIKVFDSRYLKCHKEKHH